MEFLKIQFPIAKIETVVLVPHIFQNPRKVQLHIAYASLKFIASPTDCWFRA